MAVLCHFAGLVRTGLENDECPCEAVGVGFGGLKPRNPQTARQRYAGADLINLPDAVPDAVKKLRDVNQAAVKLSFYQNVNRRQVAGASVVIGFYDRVYDFTKDQVGQAQILNTFNPPFVVFAELADADAETRRGVVERNRIPPAVQLFSRDILTS